MRVKPIADNGMMFISDYKSGLGVMFNQCQFQDSGDLHLFKDKSFVGSVAAFAAPMVYTQIKQFSGVSDD